MSEIRRKFRIVISVIFGVCIFAGYNGWIPEEAFFGIATAYLLLIIASGDE